jgi:hypothetical protein
MMSLTWFDMGSLLAEYRAADTEPAAPTDVPAGPPQPTPA